jgi:hypothetical protein
MVGTTLVAAAAGFLAILCQVRSSSKQLRDQIKAQRHAEQVEQDRQKRAVATANAFEIDCIYRAFVRDVEVLFKSAGSNHDFAQKLVGKRIERLPFAVYEGCAPLLGELPAPLVEAVVHFYGGTTAYLMTINELHGTLLRAQDASLGDRRWHEVDVLVQQVQNTAPHLGKLAAEVSERLCEFAEIPENRMAALAGTHESHAQTH